MNDALQALMRRYDQQYPSATPFQRGAVEFEHRKTLEALSEAGFDVVERKPNV